MGKLRSLKSGLWAPGKGSHDHQSHWGRPAARGPTPHSQPAYPRSQQGKGCARGRPGIRGQRQGQSRAPLTPSQGWTDPSHTLMRPSEVNQGDKQSCWGPRAGPSPEGSKQLRSKIHRVKFIPNKVPLPLPSPGQGQTGWGKDGAPVPEGPLRNREGPWPPGDTESGSPRPAESTAPSCPALGRGEGALAPG